MTRWLGIALLAAIGAAPSGCAQAEGDAGCSEVSWCEADRSEVGAARAALTLEALAGTGGCSTAGAETLSNQLIDEMLCLAEGRLVRFEHANVTLTSTRVHPYLSPAGRDALYRAADSGEIRINSALRTISDQYLLYAGCSVAATPGRSNHETGRAIDVDNWSARLAVLQAAGFTHPLPGTDDVHFEATGDDLRSISVLAFQRLWNVNHPEDVIADDGVTGPQTLARLARAPAEGFGIDHVCSVAPPVVDAGVPPVLDAGVPPVVDAGEPTADAGAEPGADLGADLGAADASLYDTRPRAVDVAGCGCSSAGASRAPAGTGAAIVLCGLIIARLRRRVRGGHRSDARR